MENMIKIRLREELERIEQKTLAPYATRSAGAHKTRLFPEEEHPYRTAFQRDRDRIIHSRAFRRLKHKRQVFLIHTGDHYRTRLTHTLEVSQISRIMAKSLGLNEELVEAIALGHDLGHTPFGHMGEVILNRIMQGEDDLDGTLPKADLGGFKHNYQSLRVVDKLEKKYAFEGLNLTSYVREGILKHTGLKKGEINYPDLDMDDLHLDYDCATTLEGQVVAIADEVAQRTHDLEDGIRAGFVSIQEVRSLKIVQQLEKEMGIEKLLDQDPYLYRNTLIKSLINLLVIDIIEATRNNIEDFYRRKGRLNFFDEEVVKFSPQLDPLQKELDEFLNERVISKPDAYVSNVSVDQVIKGLFRAYFLRPKELGEYSKYFFPQEPQFETLPNYKNKNLLRLICDYIAGMTDNFALEEFHRLFPSRS